MLRDIPPCQRHRADAAANDKPIHDRNDVGAAIPAVHHHTRQQAAPLLQAAQRQRQQWRQCVDLRTGAWLQQSQQQPHQVAAVAAAACQAHRILVLCRRPAGIESQHRLHPDVQPRHIKSLKPAVFGRVQAGSQGQTGEKPAAAAS